MAHASPVFRGVIAVLLAILAIGCAASNPPLARGFDKPSSSGRSQQAAGSVKVVSDLPKGLFEDAWENPQWEATASPIDSGERGQWQSFIEAELQKYPSTLFSDRFAVYLCAELRFGSIPVGGTFWWSGVAISIETDDRRRIALALHHEIASWLFYRYAERFDTDEWKRVNDPAFTYTGNQMGVARQALLTGIFDQLDHQCFGQGFLNIYSKTSLDNDFSEMAAQLFLNDARFWNAVAESEALARKASIVLDFYLLLDGRFTEEFFRSLSLTGERAAP